MKPLRFVCILSVSLLTCATLGAPAPEWEWAGWGGGGFYYACAFHPTQEGVLYMGGDVAGMYKSEDHGLHWRLINDGLADYGVFSLAVSRTSPQTVYAATPAGLCKSDNAGEKWRLLPNTGPSGLHLTGEKNRSIRCIAVDPSDDRIVYAGSPEGKIFKSVDGGETWAVVYQKTGETDPPGTLRVQFGKVNQEWYGGFWMPLSFPQGVTSADCVGIGITFKGDGRLPRDCFLTLRDSDGVSYRSRNLREIFGQTEWRDLVFRASDFALDPDWARKNPDKAKAYTGTPNWSTVNRVDLVCVGPLMDAASVGKLTRFFWDLTRTPDGQSYPAAEPFAQIARDFAANKSVAAYGNIRVGEAKGGPVYSVAVAEKNPSVVLAATDDVGVLISRDGGETWQTLNTPQRAGSVAIAPSDPNVMYATFFQEGVRRSNDGGETWTDISAGLPRGCSLVEVAVSPSDPLHVYLIGSTGWNGAFFYSGDGGFTWVASSRLKPDAQANPTLPDDYQGTTSLSNPKNLAINPRNPQELYIAANWRPCHSEDGGRTWNERVRGADISCIYDLRFFRGRTYACAMDEGALVSEDDGRSWHAVWPRKWDVELSGHAWRLAISDNGGVDRIVSTCSPWDSKGPNRVVISEDGGKTVTRTTTGLPATNPTANTMWGTGYPRALAADPRNPKLLYLGIDGDPSPGTNGGGVFRSEDGGYTWTPLPSQPGSRRMFFGLAVDPTDSKRLYWGACGAGGGLYRSEDGGATWQLVFKNEQWVFNVHVAADGTVYCPGKDLWRSTDHGQTWKRLTRFTDAARVIVALETDPAAPHRIWFAQTTWGGAASGGVYESTDAGATWTEITSNLPYRKPLILRYNSDTRELWAAGVCLYKCKR